MQTVWLLCAVLLTAATGAAWADQTPQAVPELHVYKTGFVKGEEIEFTLELKGATRQQIDVLNKAGVVGRVTILSPTGKKDLPVPSGRFAVTLTQTLNVLIGDRRDAHSAYYPVRLPLRVTTEFTSGSAR